MLKFLNVLGELLASIMAQNKEQAKYILIKLFSVKNLVIILILIITILISGIILYFNKDTVFSIKFKNEINHIPQSIDQNLREDSLISHMHSYSKECGNQGYFIYYRIEVRENLIDLQIKHIIGYSEEVNASINLLTKDIRLKRYTTKKSKASNRLQEILLSVREGYLYYLDRDKIENLDSHLEPFLSSFSLIESKYVGFRYIPIIHNRLGLIILLGYLEINTLNKACSSSDISVMLEEMYRKYKN